ncbi:hypothetical protein CQA77_30435, partial [Klebsiella pneumoniae]
TLIGGGARSAYWRQMLADISGLQLDYRTGGDVGRRASRLSAAGRAALTGGKCWRISAACSSITVPGAMSA